MKLIVTGDCPSPRSERCWRAIEHTAENWEFDIEGAALEAHFLPEADLLQFALSVPGKSTATADVDIGWISYDAQADQLVYETLLALHELDLAMLAQSEEAEQTLH